MINPLDVFLWTVRRNERDVVNMYDLLSPMMQVTTGGKMLNFGYWTDQTIDPLSAQENLCRQFGSLANLADAGTAVDLGSGLSAPAMLWRDDFQKLRLYCINTNYKQLLHSGPQQNLEFLNSTSTILPFQDCTVDRVLALESSQHFRPYVNFVAESRRILKATGVLAIALPVVLTNTSVSNLGMLKLTWSSEHYLLDDIRELLRSGGFEITTEKLIGRYVYDPLADFYFKHRKTLKKSITSQYPIYVEKILSWSLDRMKKAFEDGIIEYAFFRCVLR